MHDVKDTQAVFVIALLKLVGSEEQKKAQQTFQIFPSVPKICPTNHSTYSCCESW